MEGDILIQLKDIVEHVVDNRGKSAPVSDSGEHPLIEINAIGGFHPDFSAIRKYVSSDVYNCWFRAGHPQKNDILLPTVGTIGIASLMDETKGCIAQNLIALRIKKSVCAEFVYYYLKSEQSKQYLHNLNIGGVQPSIKVPHLLAMPIDLPPYKRQREIADILLSLDNKIANNNHIIHHLEEQAQALYKSWFVDFIPFQDRTFIDSELGKIPYGWAVKPFLSVVKLLSGGTPKTDIKEYWNGDIPFFTPKDVGGSCFCLATEKHLTQSGLEHCNSRIFEPYTTFITARGTVGKLCMSGAPMAMNQTNYALCPTNESIDPIIVYMLSKQILASLKNKANGAVFDAITTKDFAGERILFATESVYRAFSSIVRPMYDSILRNEEQNLVLANYRDVLLPKLMSGEIAV